MFDSMTKSSQKCIGICAADIQSRQYFQNKNLWQDKGEKSVIKPGDKLQILLVWTNLFLSHAIHIFIRVYRHISDLKRHQL